MRLRFPTVGSVRLIDRPPEIPTHDYYKLSSFEQEIYLYFNIYGHPMNNVISDKVALILFSNNGDNMRSFGDGSSGYRPFELL